MGRVLKIHFCFSDTLWQCEQQQDFIRSFRSSEVQGEEGDFRA